MFEMQYDKNGTPIKQQQDTVIQEEVIEPTESVVAEAAQEDNTVEQSAAEPEENLQEQTQKS